MNGKFYGDLTPHTPDPDAKPGFDALMDEVCVGLGFCGTVKVDRPLHVTDIIPEDGPVTADQFVEWVILADNLNPNLTAEHLKRKLRDAFVRHMGGEIVDATRLTWHLDPQSEE